MKFGTLGPAGSNHDWVTGRYLDFHELRHASIALFPDFEQAFNALLEQTTDFVVQVAVHPSVAETVARYRGRAHLVDTFISPSQPMAVLTRREVEQPVSLGLVTATRDYIDHTRWTTLVPARSTVEVAQGLIAGAFDSGITLAHFADTYRDQLRVDETIGTVVDPWLVYAREPTSTETIQAWRNSPVRALYGKSPTPQ